MDGAERLDAFAALLMISGNVGFCVLCHLGLYKQGAVAGFSRVYTVCTVHALAAFGGLPIFCTLPAQDLA